MVLATTALNGTQNVYGNIYGQTVDEQGAPVPGASITLTGAGSPRQTTTNAKGEFRFVSLDTGDYTVTARLQGFTDSQATGLSVIAKHSLDVRLVLKLAARAESVEVTAQTPLLDMRKQNFGSNVSHLELDTVPTARDPWVVVQTVPAAQIDRVNTGGSESGQQSNMAGKGTPNQQNNWILDGVVMTQLAGATAAGYSMLYYDFDSFEEVQVTTGGIDPSTQTPGVQVNLITRRGMNSLHGSARIFVTDGRWVGTNTPEELGNQLAAGGVPGTGNTVDGMQDYGAEIGGPFVKDHLWLWGTYSRNQIDQITSGGLTDKTTLENFNLKLNAQPFANNAFTAYYYRADKIKFGRDAGLTRPQETSWDQTGPVDMIKLEDSHTFNENLFATLNFAYVDFRWQLVPQGSGQMRQDSSQIYHNTYDSRFFYRPNTQLSGSLSRYFQSGPLSHELKIGGLYLFNKVEDAITWEGNTIACNQGANFCGSQNVPSATLNRDSITNYYIYNYSGYLSDTVTFPRFTVNLGLRYDYQYAKDAARLVPGSQGASLVPPGTVVPPALNVPETVLPYRFKDWQPRIGVAYMPGASQKTILRATYARFTNQLYGGFVVPYSLSPGGTSGSAGIVYPWNDVNKNNLVEEGELDTSRILRSYGFNPADPASAKPVNGVDPGFGSVRTSEITLGLDYEVMPKLAISLLGTYRRLTNFDLSSGFDLTQKDYILSTTNYRENGINSNPLCPDMGHACGALPDGSRYNVPVYRVRPGTSVSPGTYTANNPDYEQRYLGFEFQAVKRYSGNWMARIGFSYNDWTQDYGPNGFVDPTNVAMYDGGLTVAQSLGSGEKSRVYVNAKWQVTASASYDFPHGISVSGSFFARQGYPLAYFQNVLANSSVAAGYERTKSMLVAPYDEYRYPSVSSLDLGVAKSLKLGGLEIRLMADCFNVLNHNTVLQRQNQIGLTGPSGTNAILEIQAPRLFRFGLRLNF